MLGDVTAERGIELVLDGELRALDTGRVRNLFAEVEGDVRRYVAALAAMPLPRIARAPSPDAALRRQLVLHDDPGPERPEPEPTRQRESDVGTRGDADAHPPLVPREE